jgi:hypothetical protein
MKTRIAALLGCAGLVLAGCGGGSSSSGGGDPVTVPGGGGTGGTPTPSPSPTPTPTPTPSGPDYAGFDELTGSQSFAGGCAVGYDRPDEVSSYPPIPFDEGLTIAYDADTQQWSVKWVASGGAAPDVTFGPDDRVAGGTDGTINFARTNAAGYRETLSIGSGNFPGLQTDYVRTAVVRYDSEIGPFVAACAFGVPTQANDYPESGEFSYDNLQFVGDVRLKTDEGMRHYAVTASDTSLDVAGNDIVSIIHLSGRELIDGVPSGPVVELGQFKTETGFDPAFASFTGKTNSRDYTAYITLPGADLGFFGPQGSEVAYVISYYGSGSGVAVGVIQVTGVLVAGR